MKRRILGIVLACCMMLSLLPVTALATDGGVVATIGENEYTSLAAAVADAQDGNTIYADREFGRKLAKF